MAWNPPHGTLHPARARHGARRRQRERAAGCGLLAGADLQRVLELHAPLGARAEAEQRHRAAGEHVAAVEQQEDAAPPGLHEHEERRRLAQRHCGAAHVADDVARVRRVRVLHVLVGLQAAVAAAGEGAVERRVGAGLLVSALLGELDVLAAAVGLELAGGGHGGQHGLQLPVAEVADGLAAGPALAVHPEAAAAARAVPVLALEKSFET